ncbi:MAG: hypothetical protein HWN67_05780 [Candidatus Helarchaeota archaeon]|nr:hypothetical protein [Candidatus Helarchaeota archaeon]
MASTNTTNQEIKAVWSPELSTTAKINYLKNHFNGKWETLTFWELYRFVKTLKS